MSVPDFWGPALFAFFVVKFGPVESGWEKIAALLELRRKAVKNAL